MSIVEHEVAPADTRKGCCFCIENGIERLATHLLHAKMEPSYKDGLKYLVVYAFSVVWYSSRNYEVQKEEDR